MKVFPPFQLDTTNQCLWRITGNGIDERITLKPKVYSILEYFVNHPGRLVTQQELLDAIWRDTHVQPEVLKRHIFDLARRSSATIRNHRYFSKPCLGAATNSLLRFRTPKPASLTQYSLESDWLDATDLSMNSTTASAAQWIPSAR